MQINDRDSVRKGNRLFTVQCFCVGKDHTQRVCKARIVRRCNGKAAHCCRINRRQRMGPHIECIKRKNTGHIIQCGGVNQAGNDRFAAGFRIGSGVLQTVIGRIRCIKRIKLIATDLLPDAVAFRISCEVIVAAIQFSDQRTAAGCLGICVQGKCICCAGECPDSFTDCGRIIIVSPLNYIPSPMSAFTMSRNNRVDHIECTAIIIIGTVSVLSGRYIRCRVDHIQRCTAGNGDDMPIR